MRETQVQQLYEATARSFEAGNLKIMELGKNIAGVIAAQQNEYMGQIKNVYGAMEIVREKFADLYQEVTVNRRGVMTCDASSASLVQRLLGFQQAGD